MILTQEEKNELETYLEIFNQQYKPPELKENQIKLMEDDHHMVALVNLSIMIDEAEIVPAVENIPEGHIE